MKFTLGWASHLYYWAYPGLMVGVSAVLFGYLMGKIFPTTFSASQPSFLLMLLFCGAFAMGIAYAASRGISSTDGFNAGINRLQILAILIFSVMAIVHRLSIKEGDIAWHLDSTHTPTQFVQASEPKRVADGKDPAGKTLIPDPTGATEPKVDDKGEPVWVMEAGKPRFFRISYKDGIAFNPATKAQTFNHHGSAVSVLQPHALSYVMIQACIAILVFAGFESVVAAASGTAGSRRITPTAVIVTLIVQGGFCYLLQYFAASYFMSTAYSSATAATSSAPVGDMTQLVGTWAFGSATVGWWFMMIMAATVFLALIGITLSSLNTSARISYAMGRDEHTPVHFGLLRGHKLTPYRTIWVLGILSAVIGVYACSCFLCGPAAAPTLDSHLTRTMKAGFWYNFGDFSFSKASAIPNSLLVVTLVSNLGTFLLYLLTCWIAIAAFREHRLFRGLKRGLMPIFGFIASLACIACYLIGPFMVPGMSRAEPWLALAIAAVWGVSGAIYFVSRGKMVTPRQPIAAGV